MTIECVLAAFGKRPRWSELLVAGNFKYDLTGPEGADRDEKISADPEEAGLEDMLEEFRTCLCPCNKEKWNVDHVQYGEGGAVPDGLYPGYGPSSLQ